MRPPNRLSLYTRTIVIPLFSLIFLISAVIFYAPVLCAQEGQINQVPETGNDSPGIRRLALIGFDTPEIDVKNTSTYTSSNDFFLDYMNCLGFVFTSVVYMSRLVRRTTCLGLDMQEKHIFQLLASENVYSHSPLNEKSVNTSPRHYNYTISRALGASYGQAFGSALASGLAEAVSAGISAGFQMADIEKNLDMLIGDNTFGSILKSALHREMSSVCAFEIAPLQEIDRLGLTQDTFGNYKILHSRADVQAVIEGTIKEFVFLWNQNGLVNSLGIVVEIKLTDTSTGKVLRQKTYPYYTMTNDDNSFVNKRTLDYFYNSDNLQKEFTKASVLITNKIMNDYKLYFQGDYFKYFIKDE